MSWDQSSRERAEMSRASERVTGRRYCTACQSQMPIEGGKMKAMSGGRAHRFVCRLCAERTTTRTRSGSIGKAQP